MVVRSNAGGNLKRVVERGPLIIIGGAEDKEGDRRILRQFLKLAGGSSARLVVLAIASTQPQETGSRYIRLFKELGAGQVRLLDLFERDDAQRSDALEMIAQATGVFFTGGNPIRITRLLGGTAMDKLLHQRHRRGLVLAGTSAGAAMMSGIMIVGGISQSPLRARNVELGPGMEFLPGVIIDQHFEERWRLQRLLSAVAQHPHNLGLGIDEDTAVVVRDGLAQVIGRGAVTVVDGKRLTFVSRPTSGSDEALALCGVTIHVLPDGFGYDLKNRTPVTKRERSKTRHRRPAEAA